MLAERQSVLPRECTNYRAISFLSLHGTMYAQCLEKRCRDIIESNLENKQCVLTAALQTKYPLSSSFFRNFGSMLKMSIVVLMTWKK